MLTILDGSTFCVSDAVGDFTGGTEGLYADDTRMLSLYRLLVDGAAPLLLSSRAIDYFSATFYLRNAPTDRLSACSIGGTSGNTSFTAIWLKPQLRHSISINAIAPGVRARPAEEIT